MFKILKISLLYKYFSELRFNLLTKLNISYFSSELIYESCSFSIRTSINIYFIISFINETFYFVNLNNFLKEINQLFQKFRKKIKQFIVG